MHYLFRKPVLIFVTLIVYLSTILACYWLGIQGAAFQFDDHPNLSVLGDFGSIDSFQNLVVYLRSGIAGPTGRPLSLLSFLLDGQIWPTDPLPFLRTNALIHAVNGFLIFLIGELLLERSTDTRLARHAIVIAGLAAMLWLLHPYWVSTVLYAVQRMAILSAFFCLLGLALYLKGRTLTQVKATCWCGWWLASVGVICGTGFGVLAKENAAVLPVLILVVEWMGVRPLWQLRRSTRIERAWFLVFLLIPTITLLAYLGHKAQFGSFFELRDNRLFTPYERVITQPGILLSYLYDLLIPKAGYAGLYQENYPFARSLISPPTTLISLILVASLAGLAVWLRKRLPLVALALLFFLAGHLIESTVLMLELKFEHRSYLPAALLFLPVAAAIVLGLQRLRWVVGTLLVVLLAAFTFNYAALWGRPMDLAVYWAERNPDSCRAQIVAASRLARSGHKQISLELLQRATTHHPNSPALRLTYASFLQSDGETSAVETEVRGAVEAIRTGPYDAHVNMFLEPLLDDYWGKLASALPRTALLDIIAAFENRPEYNRSSGDRQNYAYALARLELTDGNLPAACEHLLAIQRQSGRIGTDLEIFRLLASKGYYADAHYFLTMAQNKIALGTAAGLRFPPDWYRAELKRLERNLAEDEAQFAEPQTAICGTR